VLRAPVRGGSPTTGLLLGLVITLTAVVAYSWYITRQITGLRTLQTELADRNRRGSLQLLRIQNDLNSLGLAMRDMLDTEERYPLTAWSAQFERLRVDLEDALRREQELTPVRRTPEQRRYLEDSMAQFWDAAERIFLLARSGKDDEARAQIRVSLQARQEALSTAVARLLVANNETEEETSRRIQAIYGQVQRQVYWFLTATLVAIVLTSAYLIRSNRRLFAAMAALSDERRELAQNLITARESTLREIARELHDEFGQILTAIGSMLTRARRHTAEDSPLRTELRETSEIAQATLDRVRGLSQALHPSILDELGLDSAVEWYISTVEKQLGLDVSYERTGPLTPVDPGVAIQVYRVLQEALSNVARHAGTNRATVRMQFSENEDALALEVEDHGKGLTGGGRSRGLGVVTMRERAALVGGTIEFLQPREGGTIVRLRVPLEKRKNT
jgi:signal transduction histidine kinase